MTSWHGCTSKLADTAQKYALVQNGKPVFKKNDGDVLKIVSEASEGRIWHSVILTECTQRKSGYVAGFRVPPNSLVQLKVCLMGTMRMVSCRVLCRLLRGGGDSGGGGGSSGGGGGGGSGGGSGEMSVTYDAIGHPRAWDMGSLWSEAQQQMHRGWHQLHADDRWRY